MEPTESLTTATMRGSAYGQLDERASAKASRQSKQLALMALVLRSPSSSRSAAAQLGVVGTRWCQPT